MNKIATLSLLPLALTAACGQVVSTPKPLTEKQSAVLTKELNGKIAGKPVNCISEIVTASETPVGDKIILYRVSKKLVYKNELQASCHGLDSFTDIFVYRQYTGQRCKGDTLRMVDRNTGMTGGVCSLGEFTPYLSGSRTND